MFKQVTAVCFENVTRGDRFEQYRPESSQLELVGSFTFTFEAVGDPDADYRTALDLMWAIGNREYGESGPQWPSERRSQSVGDVVVIDGLMWAVAPAGWMAIGPQGKTEM